MSVNQWWPTEKQLQCHQKPKVNTLKQTGGRGNYGHTKIKLNQWICCRR